MITHDNIKNLVKSQFLTCLKEYNEGVFNDYANSLAFYNENSVNDKSDIRFTLKFLSSNTQLNVTDFPIQFIVEAIESKAVDVMDILNAFCLSYNESQSTVTDDIDTGYQVDFYYQTPMSINNNFGVGTNHYKAFTFEARLVVTPLNTFTTINEEDLKITIDDVKLTNLIDYSFNATHTKDSVPRASDGKAKNYNNMVTPVLSVTFVADKTNTLHKSIIQNRDSNTTEYTITIDNGFYDTIPSYTMVVQNYTESVAYGDVLKVRVDYVLHK